jgi:hypothetical protein
MIVDHLVYGTPDLRVGIDRIEQLVGVHPEPSRVRGMLAQLGLDLAVAPGPRPALIATIDGPRGRVELR